MALRFRPASATARCARRAPCAALPRSRQAALRCQASFLLAALAEAAPGSVQAPTGALIAAAAIVTIVATAGIPLALKPGQEASDTIFDSKGKRINKVTVKGPGAGAVTKKGGKK